MGSSLEGRRSAGDGLRDGAVVGQSIGEGEGRTRAGGEERRQSGDGGVGAVVDGVEAVGLLVGEVIGWIGVANDAAEDAVFGFDAHD